MMRLSIKSNNRCRIKQIANIFFDKTIKFLGSEPIEQEMFFPFNIDMYNGWGRHAQMSQLYIVYCAYTSIKIYYI